MYAVPSLDGIQRELGPNEQLLWSGKPKSGILFRSSDAIMIPFSIAWAGFAIFWETMAFNARTPVFFKLWGLMFVVVGLYMVLGRFFYDMFLRSKTEYAVTNQRVLIIRNGRQRSVQAFPIDKINNISLQERHDGQGTIKFGQDLIMGKTRQQAPAFEMIPKVRAVYDLIRQSQSKEA